MYLVVNLRTGQIIGRPFERAGWARRFVDKAIETSPQYMGYTYETLQIMTADEYVKNRELIDPMVEVINMMSGQPVLIRKSDRGTCVDPSTETYWSM